MKTERFVVRVQKKKERVGSVYVSFDCIDYYCPVV